MIKKKRPTKSVRKSARPETTYFRMDFEASFSQFSGDPSDYITVYDGKIIEENEDDSKKEIGHLILYLVERSRVINDGVSLFDVMDCLDGDSYDCFVNLFEQETEDTVWCPDKDVEAYVFLNVFDLFAESGLGEKKPLSGARKVAGLSNGNDVFQMAKLNKF